MNRADGQTGRTQAEAYKLLNLGKFGFNLKMQGKATIIILIRSHNKYCNYFNRFFLFFHLLQFKMIP